MVIPDVLIALSYLAFLSYWFVSAFGAGKSRPGKGPTRGILVRVLVTVLVIIILKSHAIGSSSSAWVQHDALLAYLGALLVLTGMSLAIYARHHLGRNWGMPMTEREHPELVTSGPYRLIRHPIYTGMLLALMGTALATSPIILVVAVILAAYFTYCAISEERVMRREFPDTYQAYQLRTKMLIPFVF